MADSQHGYKTAQLRNLLSRCLTLSELQRILSDLYGPNLMVDLPTGSITFIEYCQQSVLSLERRGLIEQRFFEAIFEYAPGRKDEIQDVATLWGVSLSLTSIQSLAESRIPLTNRYSELNGFEHLQLEQELGQPSPQRFFLGYAPTWADIATDLDVRRTILFQNSRTKYEVFLAMLNNAPLMSQVYIIFGEGGAGKTTFLRRLMYDLAQSGALVFRAYHDTSLDIRKIVEFAQSNADKPCYIFVDNGQYQAKRLAALSNELAMFPNRIVIIAGARKNEWNEQIARAPLAQYEEVYLPSITESEAFDLVSKLALHNSLGRLSELSLEERLKVITVKAAKQLLVGLLEATQAKRFRDIVLDEFQGISNEDSQFLYLAICMVTKLGLRMPEEVAIFVAQANSRLAFGTSVLPSLELVIAREGLRGETDLIPRHRSISDELLSQVCPNKSARLKICFDLFERISKIDSPHLNLQRFAAHLAQRLIRRDIIATVEEAERTVELLLSAGVGPYVWGKTPQGHSLRPQSLRTRGYFFYQGSPICIPNQSQFRVAAHILRRWLSDDDAIQIIYEGLSLNDLWNDLRLYQAIIESERGNAEIAEQIVQRILILADQNEGRGEVVLPIPLAVDIATFKSKTDTHIALEYLKLADRNVYQGMSDHKKYFLAIARLYEKIGNIDQAIATLDRGLNLVRGPAWAIEEMEKFFVKWYSVKDPERFLAWVDKRYPYPDEIKNYVARAMLKIYVANRDTKAILNIVSRAKNRELPITATLNHYLNARSFDEFDFLCNVLDIEKSHCKASLARPLLKRAILDRDKEAIPHILNRVKNSQNVVSSLLMRYLKNGDIESFNFLRGSIEQEEISNNAAVAILKTAIRNRDEEAAVEAYLRAKDAGIMLNNLIKQIAEGDLATFQFLETVLGLRLVLPDNAAREALRLAIEKRDKDGALDICIRTRDFRDIITALKQELVDTETLAFLNKVLEDTGSFKDITEGIFLPVSHLTQYRAIGLMPGRYIPFSDAIERGTLITPDQLEFDMEINPNLWKKQAPILDLQQSYCWLVYPKPPKARKNLSFQAAGIKPDVELDKVNCFSIRGQILEINNEQEYTLISIKPNQSWRTDFEPITLMLKGVLPNRFIGWFCDVRANRESNQLVIVEWQAIIRLPR